MRQAPRIGVMANGRQVLPPGRHSALPSSAPSSAKGSGSLDAPQPQAEDESAQIARARAAAAAAKQWMDAQEFERARRGERGVRFEDDADDDAPSLPAEALGVPVASPSSHPRADAAAPSSGRHEKPSESDGAVAHRVDPAAGGGLMAGSRSAPASAGGDAADEDSLHGMRVPLQSRLDGPRVEIVEGDEDEEREFLEFLAEQRRKREAMQHE